MKENYVLLGLTLALSFSTSFAQTNIFPTSGNVGIGTTNPRSPLDVGKYIPSEALGTVFGRLAEGDNEGSGTFLGVRGYETQFNTYGAKSFSIVHDFYGQTNSSINFYRGLGKIGGFITFNTYSNIERLRIDNNGNVGIGTTDPKGYKLAVAGNMIAESVKVKLQGTWPDYVFAKNYALPSLAETEKYIKEKGHLPEIPSAAEVKANGLDVEDMNAKLLKKIEEMTLQMIELNKTVKKQQSQINKLISNK